jgi:hypothetical protein
VSIFCVHGVFSENFRILQDFVQASGLAFDIAILDLKQMTRNKKKTVTTVEVTWATASRESVSQRHEVIRTGSVGENEDENGERNLPRLLKLAAKFLRGGDDEDEKKDRA